MKSCAFITGVNGQDGALLAQHLLQQSHAVVAPVRVHADTWRLAQLGVLNHPDLQLLPVRDWREGNALISQQRIDAVYHLGGFSHVGESHAQMPQCLEDIVVWSAQLLEQLLQHAPDARVFFAASSEMYAAHPGTRVDLSLPPQPNNPYGIAKLAAWQLMRWARERHGLYTATAVLFNHESEWRDARFISQKVCRAAARIAAGQQALLEIGNPDVARDWSDAGELVRLFPRMLALDSAQDFILGSGQLTPLKTLITVAFECAGLALQWHGAGAATCATDAQGHTRVRTRADLFRPVESAAHVANIDAARQALDWHGGAPMRQWLQRMVQQQMALL